MQADKVAPGWEEGPAGQRDFLRSIVDTVREPMLVLDTSLRVVLASRSFCDAFRVSEAATQGSLVYDLGNGQWDIPALRDLLERIVPEDASFDGYEVRHDFPGLGPRVMLLNARKIYRPGNHTEMLLLAIEDVTGRTRAEEEREHALAGLQAAYEREKRIADALQRPLTVEVAEDAFPGVLVATLYQAASAEAEVGGDFFDAFAMPRGRVAFAIADASGKGLAAAARTMQIKDVLRAFTREYPHSPAHIMSRLNDFAFDTQQYDPEHAAERFICMTLALFDAQTGEGSVVVAGCEPPLLLRADGSAEEIHVTGLPLGVERQTLYGVAPFQMETGDTLLLATDGITEARDASPRARPGSGYSFFGMEGLTAAARGARGAGGALRPVGQAVLDAARAFAGGVLRDDACLLLARRL